MPSDEPSQPADPAEQRTGWGTRLAIIAGLLILVVPTAVVLTLSNSVFRDQCKAQCAPLDLTYRVENIGYNTADRLQYPARCYCIRRDQRTVWEKLRDLID